MLLALAMQAQNLDDQRVVAAQWASLSADYRATLAREMAISGVEGEQYSLSPQTGGPAFLVYYSPALLRLCLQEPALPTD